MTVPELKTVHKITVSVPESLSVTNYPARELRLEFAAQDIYAVYDLVGALSAEIRRLAGLTPTRGLAETFAGDPLEVKP